MLPSHQHGERERDREGGVDRCRSGGTEGERKGGKKRGREEEREEKREGRREARN